MTSSALPPTSISMKVLVFESTPSMEGTIPPFSPRASVLSSPYPEPASHEPPHDATSPSRDVIYSVTFPPPPPRLQAW